MNSRTALVAHPHPIVVDGLAALVADAGYAVTRATEVAAVASALAAVPDLAVIAVALGGDGAARARNGVTRTLVIADAECDGAIALTVPVDRLAAAIAAVAGEQNPARAVPALTPRERDIARLVVAGHRNRGIAAALGITEGTVKMHLHNVYAKLGLESRTQLAMSARGLGA